MDFDMSAVQAKRYKDIMCAARRQFDGHRGGSSHFTRSEWKTAASLALTGLCIPSDYGGSGFGALDTALCLAAFGQGCDDTGLVFAVAAHLLAGAVPVRDFGSAEMAQRLLPGFAAGELVASNAITEDDAGSDVGRLGLAARRDGESYVLDGEKSFASNAPMADVIVTYAVTDPTAGFLGITAFAVPRVLPGLAVSEPLAKMGLASCPAGRVQFRGCRVPLSCRLGEEGQGSLIFQHAMGWERACLFAAYVGLMDNQLERCVAHARSRRQFGRRLADFQAISHRIAAMKQRVEASRLLLYRACWLIDQQADYLGPAALAKVAVSEAAVANSLDAIQIFGGTGYLTSGGIEQQLRDSVPSTLFSGTTEIQRELIAREAGL